VGRIDDLLAQIVDPNLFGDDHGRVGSVLFRQIRRPLRRVRVANVPVGLGPHLGFDPLVRLREYPGQRPAVVEQLIHSP